MATQAKQKAPKIGEIVHCIPQANLGNGCHPMIVTEVLKNNTTDGGQLIGDDVERLTTIKGSLVSEAAANSRTAYFVQAEYSKDGQRTTWHPIDSCPLEA